MHSCLLLLLSLLLAPLAHATTYYVATTGADANPGTQGQPLRTLQRAAGAVRPRRYRPGGAWDLYPAGRHTDVGRSGGAHPVCLHDQMGRETGQRRGRDLDQSGRSCRDRRFRYQRVGALWDRQLCVARAHSGE